MGLKKKSKVSAEFSMSSLTDIIFLLLIFFMLTSSLVSPNALNLKMPGKSNVTSSSKKDLKDVTITKNGKFLWNNSAISLGNLKPKMRSLKREKMTISPDPDAPIEAVVTIMDLARQYEIEAILAADPK